MQTCVIVDQALVHRLYAEGLTKHAIKGKTNLPATVVRDIVEGKPRPFYFEKGKSADIVDPCTCCKVRKKTMRFLCDHCFGKYKGVVGGPDQTEQVWGKGNHSSAK